MKIKYEAVKNDANVRERGLSFDRAVMFDFDSALVEQDNRKDYPEVRYVAIGYLESRLHVLCFTGVDGGIRVISFRKANSREVKIYEQASI